MKKKLTKLALMTIAGGAMVSSPLSADETNNSQENNEGTLLAGNNNNSDYRASGRTRRYDPNQSNGNPIASRMNCSGGKCGSSPSDDRVIAGCKSNGKCHGTGYQYPDQDPDDADDDSDNDDNNQNNQRNNDQQGNQKKTAERLRQNRLSL